jgi:hypothetical protein
MTLEARDACHSGASSLRAASWASAACLGCHGGSADVRAIHAKRPEGACAVCHDNPTLGDLASGKNTADCSGCHTDEGTDFHTIMNTAHASPTTPTCFGAGCHDASRSLSAVLVMMVARQASPLGDAVARTADLSARLVALRSAEAQVQ